MTSREKHPIGLFGGTFDPIHKGHIKIAAQLITDLRLHSIQFIPNKDPMYREKPIADAKHRLAMIRIATMRNPQMIVNDIEIQRPGPTYSIDTIINIRQKIPEQPLCLILGKDSFAQMNTWKSWKDIPNLIHLIIINRPDTPLSYEPWMKKLLKAYEICDSRKLCFSPGGYILQYEIEPMLISATEIRRKLKNAEDTSNELSAEVLRYIQQHHLYS